MSNTIRIRTTPNGGDKYLKLKLDQDFDFIEILSLKISQEEAYRKFCSDYGTVVGRVVINSGFGVPNAKVSIFIPLDEVDKNDPLISGLYPYEIITDKNSDGVRYNLLSKSLSSNNDCHTPIGTLPTKREILDNETMLGVYCKYYKFTTTTNHAGDFMIFGVPIGTYTLHIDADISDIGIASQRPYDLIRQGTPVKFFDSVTKFKGGTNLDKLVQVKTSNIGVNVQPFWGDLDNCEIGITRIDVDLNYTLTPSAVFMGSIFGDPDKNSINKNCAPRKGLGDLCEQITGSGNINMIRENIDGLVEEFDVDGGRVIDEDGTWAYQVPMNLDYMVTDETGNLILTDNPNIGIPTRARVRFKIGLDETGGEGRLRTRASYLVPNNPQTPNEIDYSFGEETNKNYNFADLYWNKIYSVSNFISRFQKTKIPTARTITGIKNVDGCDKTPFPYNRVSTDISPIFSIFCILINIITVIVTIINSVIIGAINFITGIVGGDPVPCIIVPCPSDGEPIYFAPGCSQESPNYQTSGLADCLAFSMAKSLNMYQFDFYNDWVNGSLYSFLLKYKKRPKGKEKFCEYDCEDFVGGADGNEDGVADNNCHNNHLLDTCYFSGGFNSQVSYESVDIREGLVKKVGDDLIYAASTHNNNYKLFATDIICLGSMLDCDWQGIPKIQERLVPTSYKLPPETSEFDDNGQIITCGMVEIGNNSGLFFDVNCSGLHTSDVQCLNIRHICEIGVDIDETIENTIGQSTSVADCIIGSNEIDVFGKQFRDIFIGLNRDINTPSSFDIGDGLESYFNIPNTPNYYNFASSIDNGLLVNGIDYVTFRGYADGSTFKQPKHSLFMYFGINAGRTALDKLNERYFTTCEQKIETNLSIDASATQSFNFDGTITFSLIGTVDIDETYSYTINGPDGFEINGSFTPSEMPIIITGLNVGFYTITIVDSFGYTIYQTIIVSGPTPLYSFVNVSQNVSTASASDGQITISSIGGGLAPYSFVVTNSVGAIVGNPSSGNNISAPIIINDLPVDIINGYTVTVTDSLGDTDITTNLLIAGPTAIIVNVEKTDVTCSGGNNGSISLDLIGGILPYTFSTVGPNGYTSISQNMSNLAAGTYITTIEDADGTIQTTTNTITDSNPPITGSITTTGPSNGPFVHTVVANGGSGTLTGAPFPIGQNVSLNSSITTTITDSLGCSITITG